jgi:DNA-binding IclR family transcriptional regulator
MWNMARITPNGVADTAVGTLDRAVAVLDAIDGGARTHASVVAATGLSRTTAHRLLRSLESHGFVVQHAGSGYQLGPRLLQLAARTLQEGSLVTAAHAALERLAAVTGESAQLYVAGTLGERVCLDAVQSASELRTIVPIGTALPVTAGSAGKIFLAWFPDSIREELIELGEAPTDSTPVGDQLRRQVATARRVGWASSSGERKEGVGSVSAPVLGSGGQLLAVVSISGPTTRMNRQTARRYAPAVTNAAREIERSLGVSG